MKFDLFIDSENEKWDKIIEIMNKKMNKGIFLLHLNCFLNKLKKENHMRM